MTETGQVFVSYSHQDSGRILPIIDSLREAGLDIWYDDQLTPGVDWNEELAHVIENCSACLFFVSTASMSSVVCEREVSLAVRRNRFILPVYLEEVPLSPKMELGIGNLQAIQQAPTRPAALVARILPLIEQASSGKSPVTEFRHSPTPHHRAQSSPTRMALRAGFWVLALGAAILFGYLALTTRHAVESATVGKRLAVLVFENFSGDASNDYLGSGLAEELLDTLEKIDSLHVVPRTASFYYHRRDVPFQQIVDALKVDLVLEGSLLDRQGDQLRFSAQLIDVAEDKHAFSKIYETSLRELLGTKQEITQQVLLALQAPQGGEPLEVPTFDGAAYDLYLKGKELLRNHVTRDDQERAERFFEEALSVDPTFTLALSGWCQIRLEMFVQSREAEDYDRAQAVCSDSLEAPPLSVDSLVALGTLHRLSNEIDAALDLYEQALTLDGDNEPALYGLSRCHESLGDFQQAEQFAQRAIEADRRYWKAYTGYAGFLYRQGRYLEAAEQSRQITLLVPDNPVGWGNLGASYFAADRWEEAAEPMQQALTLAPTRHGYGNLGALYYYLHRFEDARELLEEGVERFPRDYRLLGKLAAVYRLDPATEDLAEEFYKRAFETTSSALLINPDDAVLLGYHGYFAAAIGLQRNAGEAIERARALLPSNPEVYYLEAYVRVLTEDPRGWESPYEQALARGYSARQAASDPMFHPYTLEAS